MAAAIVLGLGILLKTDRLGLIGAAKRVMLFVVSSSIELLFDEVGPTRLQFVKL
ncbi:hypothetical protein PGTUg99_005336 [Puccinia graminis f. sp. tritici]|uniref:Uncharacterized protein n=1 Tax=Puccinia graminis f. sp. tritici TaxID=56615 RepID=A0A5B0P4G4_PUCGR|nr:hypothetical protein PGTUg99_005336 [Puccinia graminis f. sp. tritici]